MPVRSPSRSVRIRKLALKAFKDPAFKPEDAGDKWNATERLKYAGRLFSVYNTAANALMVAQEGERRAYGFDYRDQRKATYTDAQDQTRRAELMTEIAGLIEIITSKEPEIVEGECHQHTGDDQTQRHARRGQARTLPRNQPRQVHQAIRTYVPVDGS
jgi:hypothetical protein